MIQHYTLSALVVREERVLVVRHRKRDMWLFPGGHTGDESFESGLLREAREEVGLDVEILGRRSRRLDGGGIGQPLPFCVLHEDVVDDVWGFHQHIDHVYLCRSVGNDVPHVELREISDARWIEPGKLAQLHAPPELEVVARAGVEAAASPQCTSVRRQAVARSPEGPRTHVASVILLWRRRVAACRTRGGFVRPHVRVGRTTSPYHALSSWLGAAASDAIATSSPPLDLPARGARLLPTPAAILDRADTSAARVVEHVYRGELAGNRPPPLPEHCEWTEHRRLLVGASASAP